MESIKKWWKKSMHVSTVLLLIAILGIGLTMAYFTDTEAAINIFSTGKVSVETKENAEGFTKNGIGVTVANDSVPCYVRMRVDVPTLEYETVTGDKKQAKIILADETTIVNAQEWNAYSEGETLPANINGTIVTAGWTKYGEFWYLSQTLAKGEWADIINSLTYEDLVDGTTKELPDGITFDMLTIPITSEAIQKEGITVSTSGAEAARDAFAFVENN